MVEKVGYTRPVQQARPMRKAGSVAAPGFAEALAQAEAVDAAEGIDAAAAIASVGGVGSLLGAQEVDAHEARRRKALKRGRLAIETLERLRNALLFGVLPISTLRQLEQLVAEEREEATDPTLRAILDEIDVRAAVELAKLEMSGLKGE